MTIAKDNLSLKGWQAEGVAAEAVLPQQAERGLFDRPTPSGLAEEWAALLAGQKEKELPGAVAAFVFRLQEERLALPTIWAGKVLGPLLVQRVPFRSNAVFLGLVNVEGALLPCVSLAAILGLASAAPARSYQRLLLVSHAAEHFVFPVDEVLGIQRVLPDLLQAPPRERQFSSWLTAAFTRDAHLVGLLDEEQLLASLQGSLRP